MSDDTGLLSRLLGDPVRVRGPAGLIGLCLAAVSGVSYLVLDAGWLALLYGFTWLALPLVAGVLGYGIAFFVQHGLGARRALLEVILGLLVAIVSCAVLSTIDRDAFSPWGSALAASLAGLLYLALFRALANGIALALGRGLDYAGKRIQQLDDDGW
jgi:peptidoglycan/LPS O-acetylase OafA/YrhL